MHRSLAITLAPVIWHVKKHMAVNVIEAVNSICIIIFTMLSKQALLRSLFFYSKNNLGKYFHHLYKDVATKERFYGNSIQTGSPRGE